jgi:hypothetical protein
MGAILAVFEGVVLGVGGRRRAGLVDGEVVGSDTWDVRVRNI